MIRDTSLFSALTYQTPQGYRDTVDMETNGNFDYPGTYNASKAILDLIEYQAIPENTIYLGSWHHQIGLYNYRKAAMIYTFNWNFPLMNPEIVKESIVIPIPKISNLANDTSQFIIGGIAQSICVNRQSWNDPEK